MSPPWRPSVAALALAGFVASGIAPLPARATLGGWGDFPSDSLAADSTRTADSTRVSPAASAPRRAPAPPPSAPTSAPAPAPSLQAELKEPPASRTRAWVSLGTGAALTLGSFFVAREADRAYDDYQNETDPSQIEDHFQRAEKLDKISAGMLIAGQAALALGIYWGFIKRPDDARARVSLAPDIGPHRTGVAVVVPLP